MTNKKKFVFMYPINPIFDYEIKNGSCAENKGIDAFANKYKAILNQCIDVRYRQNGFEVNYVLFDDTNISDVIDLKKDDKIIGNGLDHYIHTTQQADGSYTYPDNNYILDQLGAMKEMKLAGFHMWDCVEKLARTAHGRGINTLVDEDLTEFFPYRIHDADFKIDKYPTYDAKKHQRGSFDFFMEQRKSRPWLWQDYK